MPPPFPLPSLCDIYRPAGAAAPVASGVPCRWVPSLWRGLSSSDLPTNPNWVGGIDVALATDIRDGCVLPAGSDVPTYNPGDEVRIVMAGLTFVYLVTWVEVRYIDTPEAWKRAYLTRDYVIGW